jgi:hypothetical protein
MFKHLIVKTRRLGPINDALRQRLHHRCLEDLQKQWGERGWLSRWYNDQHGLLHVGGVTRTQRTWP